MHIAISGCEAGMWHVQELLRRLQQAFKTCGLALVMNSVRIQQGFSVPDFAALLPLSAERYPCRCAGGYNPSPGWVWVGFSSPSISF